MSSRSGVNAMTRYVYEARGTRHDLPSGKGGPSPTPDVEAGEETTEGDEVISAPAPPRAANQAHEDPVDALLRKERERTAGTAPAAKPPR